jgi:Tfp pilus assembly protein PilN
MRGARVGLVLGQERVTVAVLAARRVDVFTLDVDENSPARIAAELRARGAGGRTLRLGLERSLAVVKALEVPRTTDRDLRKMLAFELERRVPFPPEGMLFDGIPIPGAAEGPSRLAVAACDGRVGERLFRLAHGMGRRPSCVTVASHDLRGLVPRTLAARRAVWVHRANGLTNVLFVDRGVVRLSRSLTVDAPGLLATEIARTLPVVEWTDCDGLWISGDEAPRFIEAPEMAALGARPSAPPYTSRAAARIAQLPAEDVGLGLLALAVAAGYRRPSLDLLSPERRPWTPARHHLVTVGTVAMTAGLGLALLVLQSVAQERHLGRLAAEIRRLEPEVKTVERLTTEVAQQQRLLATLRGLQGGGLRPLAVLLDLTELLPADAWLQTVSMDRQGVELTGQATAASALIPLLEGSPRLDRVEFTSPVTKVLEKERFRVRANWEAPR